MMVYPGRSPDVSIGDESQERCISAAACVQKEKAVRL